MENPNRTMGRLVSHNRRQSMEKNMPASLAWYKDLQNKAAGGDPVAQRQLQTTQDYAKFHGTNDYSDNKFTSDAGKAMQERMQWKDFEENKYSYDRNKPGGSNFYHMTPDSEGKRGNIFETALSGGNAGELRAPHEQYSNFTRRGPEGRLMDEDNALAFEGAENLFRDQQLGFRNPQDIMDEALERYDSEKGPKFDMFGQEIEDNSLFSPSPAQPDLTGVQHGGMESRGGNFPIGQPGRDAQVMGGEGMVPRTLHPRTQALAQTPPPDPNAPDPNAPNPNLPTYTGPPPHLDTTPTIAQSEAEANKILARDEAAAAGMTTSNTGNIAGQQQQQPNWSPEQRKQIEEARAKGYELVSDGKGGYTWSRTQTTSASSP